MASGNKLNDLDEAIIVALGSNLPGEYASSQGVLEAALGALEAAGLKIVARSGWWRSAAWPEPSDPPFLNGVALVETPLSPAETLAALHRIEEAFGRQRSDPNAPRTLDLDLIAYGRTVSAEPALPHPRAHDRRFVMGPLAEIAPGWRHPVLGEAAKTLAGKAQVALDAEPASWQDQTMNDKPPGVEEEARDWGNPQDESWVDAWIERNKDALNASLKRADKEFAEGRHSTFTADEFLAKARLRWAARSGDG